MTGPAKTTIDRGAAARLVEDDGALGTLRELAGENRAYLVGGSVRDALLGGHPADLDVVVEGPVAGLAVELDPDAVLHERFDTAEVSIGGRRMDMARARSETYRRPGALPEVEPATIDTDLARRDFTINAIAIPLDDPETLIDPCGGTEDLERRAIRVIHPQSFRDDPTRALRAARYAARLGFDVDHRTADLLPAVDLATVSPQRLHSELGLMADEPNAVEAVRLASAWGLIDVPDDDLQLLAAAFEILGAPEWQGWCDRIEILEAIAGGAGAGDWRGLVEYPGSPSRASDLAVQRDPVEILLARAGGAEWLDDWVSRWRGVRLAVTGDDLIDAGVPKGELVGEGLRAARVAALDNGVSDREGQLAAALAAAGPVDGQRPQG